MTLVLPPGAEIPAGLLRRAAETAGFMPAAVLVEDASGAWLPAAEALEPGDRSRAVLLAETTAALEAAVELGLGGAAWLPPATAAVAEAARAAAGAPRPAGEWDPALAGKLLAGGAVVLRLPAWSLWRREAGSPRVLEALERVREACGGTLVPPAGVAIPAGRVSAARTAWAEAVRGGPLEGIALAGAGARGGVAQRFVRELPGGHLVGCWGVGERPQAPPGAWSGLAERGRDGRWWWHLEGAPAGALAVGWDRPCEGGCAAIRRLPAAWAAGGPGSPGWLLLERRVVEIAQEGGLPWVAGVDTRTLSGLQALGRRCWVEGPAVPGP